MNDVQSPANMQDGATAGVSERSSNQPVSAAVCRQRCRELATGEVNQATLARRWGVTRSSVTRFMQRHADEIEAIRRDLANEFAGLWIAQKENRLAAYQDEYQLAAEARNATHHEWIKTRVQILHVVAEELGQLPPRTQISVIPVQHVLVVAGASPDAVDQALQ